MLVNPADAVTVTGPGAAKGASEYRTACSKSADKVVELHKHSAGSLTALIGSHESHFRGDPSAFTYAGACADAPDQDERPDGVVGDDITGAAGHCVWHACAERNRRLDAACPSKRASGSFTTIFGLDGGAGRLGHWRPGELDAFATALTNTTTDASAGASTGGVGGDPTFGRISNTGWCAHTG